MKCRECGNENGKKKYVGLCAKCYGTDKKFANEMIEIIKNRGKKKVNL